MCQESRGVHSGIVVMMDALGVADKTIKLADDFYDKKENILKETQAEYEQLSKGANELKSDTSQTITFADNVIITWNLKELNIEEESQKVNPDDLIQYLPSASLWIQIFFKHSLKNNILFRGAISIGTYVTRGTSTILGPAIGEASQWYEKADWMGVIATPSTSITISYLDNVFFQNREKNTSNQKLEHYFVQYDVPCKDKKRKLWTVSWPMVYQKKEANLAPEQEKKRQLSTEFLEKFYPNNIPTNTEEKYFNTILFFDWFANSILCSKVE